MVGGGDARLLVASATGLNRYGTTPRPRPEAIHFSSSTASSVSDYGFALCDLLRRRMLRAVLRGVVGFATIREAMADAVREEIAAWLGLEPDEADVVLSPSGTDTELLAVMLALAAGGSLTNVLIAPEETGRGVVLAGGGTFFDDTAAAGLPVRKGTAAWPDRVVRVSSVSIRDEEGLVRPAARIAADTRAAVVEALARGDRVLLHVLLGSKTGLSAPDLDLAAELEREAGGRLDVVVDACQLRVTPGILGGLVRRGWLVQVTGSKFLTGPPFSGALVIPGVLRGRANATRALQATAAAVSRPREWPTLWRDTSPGPARPLASPGPLLRWAAALAEAALLRAVPVELSRYAFASFGAALRDRLARSAVLRPLDPIDEHLADLGDEPPGLAAHSIICFAILDQDGGRPLSLAECQRLFELLNSDVSGLLPGLGPTDRALAAQPAHIGQPVELRPGASGAPSVLRLVVGARFFTIVGFAEEGATEAALASEIADATRAIDKLELLVRHWAALRPA